MPAMNPRRRLPLARAPVAAPRRRHRAGPEVLPPCLSSGHGMEVPVRQHRGLPAEPRGRAPHAGDVASSAADSVLLEGARSAVQGLQGAADGGLLVRRLAPESYLVIFPSQQSMEAALRAGAFTVDASKSSCSGVSPAWPLEHGSPVAELVPFEQQCSRGPDPDVTREDPMLEESIIQISSTRKRAVDIGGPTTSTRPLLTYKRRPKRPPTELAGPSRVALLSPTCLNFDTAGDASCYPTGATVSPRSRTPGRCSERRSTPHMSPQWL